MAFLGVVYMRTWEEMEVIKDFGSTPDSCIISGVLNSNWSEGYTPKKKGSAGRRLRAIMRVAQMAKKAPKIS
jgi:hypothetical protein